MSIKGGLVSPLVFNVSLYGQEAIVEEQEKKKDTSL